MSCGQHTFQCWIFSNGGSGQDFSVGFNIKTHLIILLNATVCHICEMWVYILAVECVLLFIYSFFPFLYWFILLHSLNSLCALALIVFLVEIFKKSSQKCLVTVNVHLF